MSFIQVKDLKKTAELWEKLRLEHELIITKDGMPKAIMIGIEPDEVERAIEEIRRIRFSIAVERVRRRAGTIDAGEDILSEEAAESRIDMAVKTVREKLR